MNKDKKKKVNEANNSMQKISFISAIEESR